MTVSKSGSAMTGSDRPARVLLLESSNGPGGPVRSLRYMLTYLDRNKVEPIVGMYFRNECADVARIQQSDVPVLTFQKQAPSDPGWFDDFEQTRWYRLRPMRIAFNLTKIAWRWAQWVSVNLRLVIQLCIAIKRQQIELVFFNQDVCFHVPGAIAAKLTGTPCICRKSGGINQGDRAKRFTVPCVDLFVAISEATAADQRKHKSTKRLTMVHAGIDLNCFANVSPGAEVLAGFGVTPGKQVVACVSRIQEGKGQLEFIEAAAIVLERRSDAVFLIVGEDDPPGYGIKAQLQRRVRELGIAESVIFTGWRDDVYRIMSAAAILVHCPTTFLEGQSIACQEAMALGKPLVASINGGIPDTVIDGVTGFLVPPGDRQAMAKAMLQLLEDPQLAHRLGENGRRRVVQEFNVADRVKDFEVLFLEYALKDGRRRQADEIPALT